MTLNDRDFKEAVEKAIEESKRTAYYWDSEAGEENRVEEIEEHDVYIRLKDYLSDKGIEWK